MDAAEAARKIYAYLAVTDPLPGAPVDAVIGFGHFDLGIPRRCAELVRQKRTARIVFTGGVGVGSGDFTRPEAVEFVDELRRFAPETVSAVAAIEERSTNTGENARFLRELLERSNPDLAPGRGLRTILVVATPARQRRTALTLQREWPEVRLINAPAAAAFEEMDALYASKRENWRAQLIGEIDRLVAYPARGFIAPVEMPAEIMAAAELVKRS
ncbi:MAG TPA: YdcF family protein [Candidatus Didemnitutus sp.]|nr:YdcF family protein [Candidatus Didemnitutus sp.]